MYYLSVNLPENREPWNTATAYRENIAKRAYMSGKQIALILYRQADTSTFRYRCYNVLQATEKSDKWQAVYFFENEIDTVIKLLPISSVLVFSRLKWKHYIPMLIGKAHANNIPVYFDIDDYVCDLNSLELVTNTLNVHFGSEVDYDFWAADISRLQKTAELCDGFISTNSYLGEKLSVKFHKPYLIIRNSLNDEQIAVSELCCSQKETRQSDGNFVVGYFSGTPSHINDFNTVSEEIIQLLSDYKDISLNVVGFMEFSASARKMVEAGRIKLTPLVDFLQLQVLMAQVDVSIVPLVDNGFTNCKSELKFFEAAAVETVTLAAPTYTYRTAIQNGKNGFICRPGQWYQTIESIYKGNEHIPEMIQNAKADALSKYCGNSFTAEIETAYDTMLKLYSI